MIGSAVGKRYATALYELAHEQQAVEKIGKDLSELAASWESSEDLRTVFENPQFGVDQKRGVIEAIAAKAGVHPLLKNTLLILADQALRRLLPAAPDGAEAGDGQGRRPGAPRGSVAHRRRGHHRGRPRLRRQPQEPTPRAPLAAW